MANSVFGFTGAAETFVVPPHAPGSLEIEIWGGSGGSPRSELDDEPVYGQGNGGACIATIDLPAGTVITVVVGGVGEDARRWIPETGAGGWSLTRPGGSGGLGYPGGGGASELIVGGAPILVVGGGGGSAGGPGTTSQGGIGGGNPHFTFPETTLPPADGQNGRLESLSPAFGAQGGRGGTTIAPGAGGEGSSAGFNGSDGTGGAGGTGGSVDDLYEDPFNTNGGGGGGGYYGGGGGGAFQSGDGGGGGGGSSWLDAAVVTATGHVDRDRWVAAGSISGGAEFRWDPPVGTFGWKVDEL